MTFEDATLSGMLSSVAADPWCDTVRLVLADLYAERDDPIRESQCRLGPPPVGLVFFGYGSGDGAGSGSGYGSGDGDGDGDGYGYGYGYGDGYGYGYGSGYGSGYGYGDGYGYGYGSGYGSGDGAGYGSGDGSLTLGGKTMPEADGQNWLIVLPHGWVICGRVVKQIGPYSFAVEGAIVICRTGGVPWDELADGRRREAATYRVWGDVNIGPQFVLSRPWKGELPKVSQ